MGDGRGRRASRAGRAVARRVGARDGRRRRAAAQHDEQRQQAQQQRRAAGARQDRRPGQALAGAEGRAQPHAGVPGLDPLLPALQGRFGGFGVGLVDGGLRVGVGRGLSSGGVGGLIGGGVRGLLAGLRALPGLLRPGGTDLLILDLGRAVLDIAARLQAALRPVERVQPLAVEAVDLHQRVVDGAAALEDGEQVGEALVAELVDQGRDDVGRLAVEQVDVAGGVGVGADRADAEDGVAVERALQATPRRERQPVSA